MDLAKALRQRSGRWKLRGQSFIKAETETLKQIWSSIELVFRMRPALRVSGKMLKTHRHVWTLSVKGNFNKRKGCLLKLCKWKRLKEPKGYKVRKNVAADEHEKRRKLWAVRTWRRISRKMSGKFKTKRLLSKPTEHFEDLLNRSHQQNSWMFERQKPIFTSDGRMSNREGRKTSWKQTRYVKTWWMH